MLTYTVKKNKKTRITFRIFGIFLLLFGGMQIGLFLAGYGRGHKIGTFLCFLIAIYGIYMFIKSFKKDNYDIKYEFNDDNIVVHHRRGQTTYSYDEVEVSHIIPENEMIYSIIHLTTNKDSFIIPFSYKKEAADKIYQFVNERVTAALLAKEENEKQ